MSGKVLPTGRLIEKTNVICRAPSGKFGSPEERRRMITVFKEHGEGLKLGRYGDYDCVTSIYPLQTGATGIWTYCDHESRSDVYNLLAADSENPHEDNLGFDTVDFVRGRCFVPDGQEAGADRVIRTRYTDNSMIYGDIEYGSIQEAREMFEYIINLRKFLREDDSLYFNMWEEVYQLFDTVSSKRSFRKHFSGDDAKCFEDIEAVVGAVMSAEEFTEAAGNAFRIKLKDAYRGRGTLYSAPPPSIKETHFEPLTIAGVKLTKDKPTETEKRPRFSTVTYRPLPGSDPHAGKLGSINTANHRRFILKLTHGFRDNDLVTDDELIAGFERTLVDGMKSKKLQQEIQRYLLTHITPVQLERYLDSLVIGRIRQASNYEVPLIGVIDDPKIHNVTSDIPMEFVDRLTR